MNIVFRILLYLTMIISIVEANVDTTTTEETVSVKFIGTINSASWNVIVNRTTGSTTEADPDIQICLGDKVSVEKTSITSGHPLKIVSGDLDWNAALSEEDALYSGEGTFDTKPATETTYTYICTNHHTMIGKISFKSCTKCTGNGNTGGIGDVDCSGGDGTTAANTQNKGASVDGTTPAQCCEAVTPTVTGKCTGNTDSSEDVSCSAPNTVNKGSEVTGSTVTACCKASYNFGIANISLCPDDLPVQIVWQGFHNIQETVGDDCINIQEKVEIGSHLNFNGADLNGFLNATESRDIAADTLSDWDSTRYFRCTSHCAGARLRVACNRTDPTLITVPVPGLDGANITVATTCSRTYNATAPACVTDENNVVISNSTCQCTKPCQIDVYMAVVGDTCNNGTWSEAVTGCTTVGMSNYNAAATVDDGSCVVVVNGCTESLASNYNALANTDDGSCNAMCDTYTCPDKYSLRPNPGTISCAGNPCAVLADDHTVKIGTNYGQYAPKQDKDRCCEYDNQDFTYVEHDKFTDGTWKTVAEGGTGGCLSDKCYAKSVTKGNAICSWGSGVCKRCNYCAEDPDFTTGSNCTPKCAKYVGLTVGFGKNDEFCRMSLCHGCKYCSDRAATCDSYTCPTGYDSKDGSADTKCKGATCSDRHDRDTCCDEHSDFQSVANCNPKCAKYVGTAKDPAFCQWSVCHGCGYCTGLAVKCNSYSCPAGYDSKDGSADTKCKGDPCTDRHDRDTCCVENSDFQSVANCNSKCAKYVGTAKDPAFCQWSVCHGCKYCSDRAATCDSYTCPAGYDSKDGSADTKCKGATCTDRHDRDTCCVEHSDFPTGANCNPKCAKYVGTAKDPAFCQWSVCHGCKYCSDLAVKCNSYTCPAGYDSKDGSADTKCKGATCSDRHDRDTCCVEHSDFTTGPNCNPKCAKYKDLTVGIGKNDEFCCWRSGICSGCSYCDGKCNKGRRLRAEFNII